MAPSSERDAVASRRELSSGIKPLLVLGKIRGILDAFTLSQPELSLSDIRAATGYPTSTVQRLVANLVAEEFLDRDGDRYRVGVKFAYWAAPATRGLNELAIIKPVLEGLRDLTGETAVLFRVEGDLRVCVGMAETRHALRREMHVGKILPLHAGSAGRVLLAWQPRVAEAVYASALAAVTGETITDPEVLRADVERTRRDGYAITANERDAGAAGLSAPVFDSMGDVFGALGVSGPSLRLTPERCSEIVEPLVAAAEEATRLIGGTSAY